MYGELRRQIFEYDSDIKRNSTNLVDIWDEFLKP